MSDRTDQTAKTRWLIYVALRPGTTEAEAKKWLGKLGDQLYATPGEFPATISMQKVEATDNVAF